MIKIELLEKWDFRNEREYPLEKSKIHCPLPKVVFRAHETLEIYRNPTTNIDIRKYKILE